MSTQQSLCVPGRHETTRDVTRGTRRLLRASGFGVLAEFPLADGGRADLLALARDGALRIVEVKSCEADFRADAKWLRYREYCDRFYFAIPQDVNPSPFPRDAGLIIADAYGALLEREAPVHKIGPATRRAMLVRFGMLAAERHGAAARLDSFE